MKISLSDLRTAIREALQEELKEAGSSMPTIPASQSPGEKQFQKDMGGRPWGNPKAIPRSDTNKKDSRVFSIVSQMGAERGMTPEQRKTLRAEFDSFMAAKDPSDKLLATAESLADEFMKSRPSH